jgi:hypothetical protein
MEDYSDDPLGRRPPADGFAIASLVVGIGAVVVTFPGICCFLVSFLSLPIGATALVLGYVARRRRRSGLALAGLILGIVATSASFLILALNLIWLLWNWSK